EAASGGRVRVEAGDRVALGALGRAGPAQVRGDVLPAHPPVVEHLGLRQPDAVADVVALHRQRRDLRQEVVRNGWPLRHGVPPDETRLIGRTSSSSPPTACTNSGRRKRVHARTGTLVGAGTLKGRPQEKRWRYASRTVCGSPSILILPLCSQMTRLQVSSMTSRLWATRKTVPASSRIFLMRSWLLRRNSRSPVARASSM